MLAGALGGLVHTLTLRNNWREGVPNVIVGSVCALYLSPLALPILEPTIGKILPSDHSDLIGLSGMVVGISAMALVGFIIDVVKAGRGSKR